MNSFQKTKATLQIRVALKKLDIETLKLMKEEVIKEYDIRQKKLLERSKNR